MSLRRARVYAKAGANARSDIPKYGDRTLARLLFLASFGAWQDLRVGQACTASHVSQRADRQSRSPPINSRQILELVGKGRYAGITGSALTRARSRAGRRVALYPRDDRPCFCRGQPRCALLAIYLQYTHQMALLSSLSCPLRRLGARFLFWLGAGGGGALGRSLSAYWRLGRGGLSCRR